jgi:hypothetical protein
MNWNDLSSRMRRVKLKKSWTYQERGREMNEIWVLFCTYFRGFLS